MCGLIDAAYTFFAVACLSVCSFYPALVSVESMSRDDLDPLVRLGRASWLYMLVAVTRIARRATLLGKPFRSGREKIENRAGQVVAFGIGDHLPQ